jgi:YD repeat-containing protein
MLSFKSEDQKQNISIKDAKELLESLKLVEQKRIEISRKHSGSEAKLKELDDVEEKINNLGKKTGYTNNNGRDTQLYYNDYQKLRQEEEAKIEEKLQEYVNQCYKTTIKQYNLSSKKYEEQPIPTVSIQNNIDFLQKVILLREQFQVDKEFNDAISVKLDNQSDYLNEDELNHWIWQINNHKWNYEENNDYYYIKKDGQREEIGGKITVFVYENKKNYLGYG